MAKVFRHIGASLRHKTHDSDDTAMREFGATGVIRNLAFQEAVEEPTACPMDKTSTPTSSKQNDAFAMSDAEKEREAQTPPCQEILVTPKPGTNTWTSEPLTPSTASATAMKRGGHAGGCSTPRASQRTPAGKRLKNSTQVEEICSPVGPAPTGAWEEEQQEERPDSDDGTGAGAIAASPTPVRYTHTSVCNFTNSNPGSVQAWEEEVKRLLTAGRHEEAVHRPAPSDGMIHCTVRRVKNFLGQTLAYHLHLDSGDVFLLAARKRKKSKISNYVLSTSQEDLGKGSTHCTAKLRANFVGTEYSLAGRSSSLIGGALFPAAGINAFAPAAATASVTGPSGPLPPVPSTPATGRGRISSITGATVAPLMLPTPSTEGTAPAASAFALPAGDQASNSSRPPSPPGTPDVFSHEELAVHYKQTVLTAKGGPRVMLIATPLPDSAWAPCAPDGSDSLPACLEAARKRELPPRLERQLCMLATRPPEWDAKLKAYTLDFHGRVRASSVKNFQLVHWDHNTDRKGADLVMQFGKVEEGSEEFALDFTYPLTLQKAFAIALASTDSKLCYAI